jgi:hypothetical protein
MPPVGWWSSDVQPAAHIENGTVESLDALRQFAEIIGRVGRIQTIGQQSIIIKSGKINRLGRRGWGAC